MRKDSRRGSAAIEFAMIAPVFFLFMFGIIETGVIYFAQSSFTNAVDDAARQVRTGTLKGTISALDVKNAICNSLAASPPGTDPDKAHSGLMSSQKCLGTPPNYLDGVQVDMRVFNGFASVNYPNIIAADGSPDVNNLTIQATDACQVVLLRALLPWPVMTPFLSSLMSSMPGDKILLGSAAAFRTEPYPDAARQNNAAC